MGATLAEWSILVEDFPGGLPALCSPARAAPGELSFEGLRNTL